MIQNRHWCYWNHPTHLYHSINPAHLSSCLTLITQAKGNITPGVERAESEHRCFARPTQETFI